MLKDQARGITPAIRRAVRCGMPATEVDHIVPRSRGGGLDPENLAPACFECNHEKLDRTPEEWARDRIADGMPWPIPSLMARIVQLTNDGVIPDLESWATETGAYEKYREALIELRSSPGVEGAA